MASNNQRDTARWVDPDVFAALQPPPTPELNHHTLPVWREASLPKASPDLEITPDIIQVPGPEGAPDIELRIFRPNGGARDSLRPLIYHIHGGGFIACSAAVRDCVNSARAVEFDAVVVSVEYRLAPETPFPGPLEDCYAGLVWCWQHALALGIDTERVGVLGESAGGGLTAALALLTRDRQGPRIKAQFLIYPMVDYRTGGPEDVWQNPIVGEFVWTHEYNVFGWSAMRGNAEIAPAAFGYFSPLHADDLSGLPPSFVATGGLDLFMDENMAYAQRLSQAGVPTEFHLYDGAIHGFDEVLTAKVAQRFLTDIGNAIRRLLL